MYVLKKKLYSGCPKFRCLKTGLVQNLNAILVISSVTKPNLACASSSATQCYKRRDFRHCLKSGASANRTCLECLNIRQVRFLDTHCISSLVKKRKRLESCTKYLFAAFSQTNAKAFLIFFVGHLRCERHHFPSCSRNSGDSRIRWKILILGQGKMKQAFSHAFLFSKLFSPVISDYHYETR